VPLKEIVRRTGHSRNLVRQISRGGVRISSAPVKAPWMGTCRSWTHSGQAAVVTVPNSGAV
jgi:hypothetical protein